MGIEIKELSSLQIRELSTKRGYPINIDSIDDVLDIIGYEELIAVVKAARAILDECHLVCLNRECEDDTCNKNRQEKAEVDLIEAVRSLDEKHGSEVVE